MKKYSILAVAAALTFWTSCSNSSDKKQDKGEEKKEVKTEQKETEVVSMDTAYLEITSNDEMKYNLSELKAKAGQVVVLKLSHVGKMPKSAMGHNWILLNEGVDMAKFAGSAIKAKDSDYIPEGSGDKIIAHTKLLGGGEEDTITFKAPQAGTYTFLCSFPGHFGMMNGKFIVE